MSTMDTYQHKKHRKIALMRNMHKTDKFFYVGGFITSMLLVVCVAIVLGTIVYGALPSLRAFAFKFFVTKEWNVQRGRVFTPVVDVQNNTITIRFSAPLTIPDKGENSPYITVFHRGTPVRYTYVKSKRTVMLSLPIYAGKYSIVIEPTIPNATGTQLCERWQYIFTVSNGVVGQVSVVHPAGKTGQQPSSPAKARENATIFGALPFIYGTVVSSLLALFCTIPFALAIAVYLNEYAKNTRIGALLSGIVDLLAGIPSVIYGFWGMFFIVPSLGSNILSAAIVLSIMIMPYATAMARESIAAVPKGLYYAAYGLGATRSAILCTVVLPYAKQGIMAGIMLSFARALSETLAVTMVIGNSNRFTFSFLEPAQTIASLLANEYAEASGLKQSALLELSLVLICITVVFALLGRFFSVRKEV